MPHLRRRGQERGRADVVMISSVATSNYSANGAPYSMGKAAMEALAKGEVEIGLTFVSEILTEPGVEAVGPLPAAISTPTSLVAFVSSHARNATAARALVKYLSSPDAAATYKKVGMQPAFEVAQIDMSIATVLSSDRSGNDLRAPLMEAIETADTLVRANASDAAARRLLGSAYFQMAMQAEHRQALDWWTRAGAVFEALLADQPTDTDRQRNVALVQKYVGTYYELEEDLPAALPHHERALELDEKRLAANPGGRTVQSDVAVDLSNVALAKRTAHRLSEAAADYERCLEIRQQLAASDPQDVRGRSQLAMVHSRLAQVYVDVGRVSDALDHSRQAVVGLAGDRESNEKLVGGFLGHWNLRVLPR
jgi:tetratricopeptide (TPR) repeat protein